MKRILLKGGHEVDALSRRARKVVAYLSRAGETKAAKKSYRRRFRRREANELRNEAGA